MRVIVARALTLLTMLGSMAGILLVNVPAPSIAGAPLAQNQNAEVKPKSAPRPRPTPRPAAGLRRAPMFEMVSIPGGTFMMGTPGGEEGAWNAYEDARRYEYKKVGWFYNEMQNRGAISRKKGYWDETPQRRVTVPSFYMSKYEITQGQWQAVMGNASPSRWKGANLPVNNVMWDEAMEFCRKLSQMMRREYRLPTEEEWEYAARAGTSTEYYWGDDVRQACRYANVADQTLRARDEGWGLVECRDGHVRAAPVGSFRPNAFGLYDMTGNVWEWCVDDAQEDYRIIRGGSYLCADGCLHSAVRDGIIDRRSDNGFRVVSRQ